MFPLEWMLLSGDGVIFINFGSVPEYKCFTYELLTLFGATYAFSESYMLGNTEKYKQNDTDQVCERTKLAKTSRQVCSTAMILNLWKISGG